MKRIKNLLLTVILLLLTSLFSACVPEEPMETVWDRNQLQHWKVDQNGTQSNLENHILDDVHCDICGSDVWEIEDGMFDVLNYDAFDNLLRISTYSADGVLLSDVRNEYTYNEDGVIVQSRMYTDGVLSEETTYAINEFGEAVRQKQCVWDEEGTISEYEFDLYDNLLRAVTKDELGHVIYQIESVYKCNDDGQWYPVRTVEDTGFSVVISEYNSYSDIVSLSVYNAKDELESCQRMEYTYDDDDNMLTCTLYQDEVKISLTTYTLNEEGWSRMESEAVYNEDGSYVLYIYDEYEELIDEIFCAAE